MEITASLVKELREKTGVGLMDCKKALSQSNGDIDGAVKFLREKGLAQATKKADRATSEGKVFIESNNGAGVILEINCETDFVATNEAFAEYGNKVASAILDNAAISSIEDLDSNQIDGKAFKDFTSEYILKLGENINVNKFQRVSAEHIASYSHMGGKIGVMVAFNNKVDDGISKDIAMQIAATGPQYIKPEDVNQDDINKEKEIIANQAKNEGRPEQVIEKIVEGRISKYYKEVCLLEQAYIKDDKQAIKQILPNDTTVTEFIRYAIG